MSDAVVVTRFSDARRVLADARFAVPPVPTDVHAVGIAWLRAHVARFSTGGVHERRRALAVAELDRMDPVSLRRAARERAAALLRSGRVDVGRRVPIAVLATALGIVHYDVVDGDVVDGDVVVEDVAVVAASYHPGTDAGPAPVPPLTRRSGRWCGRSVANPDEATAARIGLLVQACDATAGLIANAAVALRRAPDGTPLGAILDETLRHDPPVRLLRRVALTAARVAGTDVAAGRPVHLDVVAANRDPARPDGAGHLTVGGGPRPCPGADHALAIASGVLEAMCSHE
jgi:cytochrome P450